MSGRSRPGASWLLLGIAGALGIALAAETLPGRQAPLTIHPAAILSPPPADAAQAAAAPPIDTWADTILNRPLFAPDRRPPALSAGGHGSLPRLAGTVRFADTALAIFQIDPAAAGGAGKTITLGLGAKVSDWTLAEIGNGSVTLVRNDRVQRLELGYAKQPSVSRSVSLAAITVLHDKRTSPFLQP